MNLRACPRCHQLRPEGEFKKPGGWCATCREAFVLRMRAIGERKLADKAVDKVAHQLKHGTEEQKAKAAHFVLGHAQRCDPLELLLDLAIRTGMAKQQAVMVPKNRRGRAWSMFFVLRKQLAAQVQAYRDIKEPSDAV